MKKQILSILTMSLLLMAFFIPSAMAEEEIINRLYAIIREQRGYTREQLSVNQMEYSDGVWGFSVTVLDHPEDEDGLLVGEMDAAGNLMTLEGPQKTSLDRQLESDLKACFNRDEGYLLLPKVREKWLPILDGLPPEELSRIFDKYVAAIRVPLSLPQEGAIPFDQAREAAISQLASEPGWSRAQAEMFRLAITAYCTPKDIGRPVYFFLFAQHSPIEDAYASARAMERYAKELKKAFGGEAPIQFAVLVDAANGELAEPIVLDYAPIRFHYLDFFIRTPEFVQAVEAGRS